MDLVTQQNVTDSNISERKCGCAGVRMNFAVFKLYSLHFQVRAEDKWLRLLTKPWLKGKEKEALIEFANTSEHYILGTKRSGSTGKNIHLRKQV